MTTSDQQTRFRFFLGGDRYLLGDDSTAIYLFDRGRPDQPLQEWPNTIDGRIAAKTRLRELDDNIVALPGAPSAALIPRGQAADAMTKTWPRLRSSPTIATPTDPSWAAQGARPFTGSVRTSGGRSAPSVGRPLYGTSMHFWWNVSCIGKRTPHGTRAAS